MHAIAAAATRAVFVCVAAVVVVHILPQTDMAAVAEAVQCAPCQPAQRFTETQCTINCAKKAAAACNAVVVVVVPVCCGPESAHTHTNS